MNKKTKLNFLGGDFNGLQMTDINNRKKVTLLNAYKKKLKNNYNLKENSNLYKEKVSSFSKLINLDAKIQLLIKERNNLLNKTSLPTNYQLNLNNNIKNSKVSSIVPVPKFTNFDNSIMKEKIIDMLPVTKSNNHNPNLVHALVTQMIDKMTSEIKNNSSNKNKLKVTIKDFYNIITELLEKILPTEEVKKNVSIKKNSLLQKFFPTPTRKNDLSVLTDNDKYYTESNKAVVISLLRFSLYVLKRDITIKRYYSSDEPPKYKYKYIIQKGSFGDIMGLISDIWPKNGKPNWQADLLDLRKDTEKLISSKKLQEGGRIRRYRK